MKSIGSLSTLFCFVLAVGGVLAVPISNDVKARSADLAEDSIIILRVTSSAYDEDVSAADPAEVLGTKALKARAISSAYASDVAAAKPAEVLGVKTLKGRSAEADQAEDSIIILRVTSSAYAEDVAAADPAEVLGTKA